MLPCRLGGATDGERVDQPKIQCGREAAVIKPGFVLPHRILKRAKTWQAVIDKIIECHLRLCWGDRPIERREFAGMIGEALLDQRQDGLRDLIGRKGCGRG